MKRKSLSYRKKATFILAASAAGYLACYPFQGHFAGGLFTSLFAAATIGGIADWFGITALFRKPLGIPFRTRIIPRNRKKLLTSLADMVEKELLTSGTIIEKLELIDFSDSVVDFIEKGNGKRDLAQLASQAFKEAVAGLDAKDLEGLASGIVNAPEVEAEVSGMLLSSVRWSLSNGYDQLILDRGLPLLDKILASHEALYILDKSALKLIKRLEETSAAEKGGRGLVYRLLFAIPGISRTLPGILAEGLIAELRKRLAVLGMPKSSARGLLNKKLLKYTGIIEREDGARKVIDRFFLDQVKKFDWGSLISKALASQTGSGGAAEPAKLQAYIEGILEGFAGELKNGPAKRAALDNTIRRLLSRLVLQKHSEIGRFIREKLEGYSDEEITSFIEEKAGDDLQIIRINGSVVGGLVGAAVFLLTCWW